MEVMDEEVNVEAVELPAMSALQENDAGQEEKIEEMVTQDTEDVLNESDGTLADDADKSLTDTEKEVLTLRERVTQLETTLQERERLLARVTQEWEEFGNCFPDADIQEIPEDVWEKVKTGIPLAYAYAMYDSMRLRKRMAANICNARNAQMSAGVPEEMPEKFYSEEKVRAMSAREMHENYARVLESMKHWHDESM